MPRGGRRPGAGRPKGSAVVRTSRIAGRLSEDGLETPLEYLLGVMRDNQQPQAIRIDAAKATLPFLHPRQASVQLNQPKDGMLIDHDAAIRIMQKTQELVEKKRWEEGLEGKVPLPV